MMSISTYSYYPGCSLHATASEYDSSLKEVFTALGVGLDELEDWNCCSASSGHSVNRPLLLALTGRNISIAQKTGHDVVMPCAGCFSHHKATEHVLRNDDKRRTFIEEAVDFKYDGTVAVRNLLDVVGSQIGLENVESRVKKPLTGLRVVGYYGCVLVRPPEIVQFENPENPVLLNHILDALKADVCQWSYAVDCCGGGIALTKPEVAAKMVNRLVDRAREAGAQAIVTTCPLCLMNLEMRQGDRDKMAVFYLTELMGLAFGLEKARSWWKAHLINPAGLLISVGLL